MRISHFKCANFRGIHALDLDFSECGGLVVLAGINGCGKTSAIEAMQLALGYDRFLQRKKPSNEDFGIEIEVDLQRSTSERALIQMCTARHGILREDGEEFEFETEGINVLGTYSSFNVPSWRMPKLVGAIGLSVGRGIKTEAKDASNILWRLKQRLINLTGMRAFSVNDKHQSATEVFSRLNDAWEMFYPESGLYFAAEVVSLNHTMEGSSDSDDVDVMFDVYLRNESGSFKVAIDDLSSGEIEILSLLGTLVSEKPYDIVFIDEPELHLNVQWHRIILDALRKVSPTTQFIVATHSPEIWDSAYSSQRFMLSREGVCNV